MLLNAIKNNDDLENLNELSSIQDQAKAVRLQDKLGKQNFHEDMKKVFEPLTDTIKNTSENITKTITEPSKENNQALENLNKKLLEIMNDRGKLASYLTAPLSKITNPENITQFKLVKASTSNRVNDLKINKTIPIIIYGNILTFRDTNKQFELNGDLLEMITNSKFNVDLASLSDKKLMYDFAIEMKFDTKALGNKSIRDRKLIKLLNTPGLMVSASVVSKTIFLSSDPNELCDRLELLLQEKHAGNNSDIINQEIVAIVDKLLEYKCISKKEHRQILLKCNLL